MNQRDGRAFADRFGSDAYLDVSPVGQACACAGVYFLSHIEIKVTKPSANHSTGADRYTTDVIRSNRPVGK